MNTKIVEALKVIEIPYGDIGWGLDVNNKEAGIQSDLQYWTEPRELHDYHLCGIYHTADVPVTINEIQYAPKDGERVYETLSRSVSDAVCTGSVSYTQLDVYKRQVQGYSYDTGPAVCKMS